MILGLTKKSFLLVVLFTVVEVITLTGWIKLFEIPVKHAVVSGIVLTVGLLVEHYLSIFAGKANTL